MLALLHFVAAVTQPAPAADMVVGHWRTETDGGVVEIARCGTSIDGRLIGSAALRAEPDLRDARNRTASLRGRPLWGLQILSDFHYDGRAWRGGNIYNPGDGRTYDAQVTMVGPGRLRLRGCVVAPLCRTQQWTRLR